MRKLIGVSVATLIWGSQVFASLPNPTANLSGDLQTISSWTAHLNHDYPALDLRVAVEIKKSNTARAVLRDLELLVEELRGVTDIPPKALMMLACRRPECGER